MAHVKMLAKQGILTEDEKDQILAGLESIVKDVDNGSLQITDEYEDIHSFVEANLIRPDWRCQARSFTLEEAVMTRWHLI